MICLEFESIQKVTIPSYGLRIDELNRLIPYRPDYKFVDCFKIKYKKLISYDEDDGYMYRLQQMVVEKEPLKYLEKFLDEN